MTKKNEAQIRANKRYEERNPDAKLRNNIARAKSTCKRYIREYATLEDLEEIKDYIKKMEVTKMTIDQQIRKLIKENGWAYVVQSCKLQIRHKKKPLNQDDWNRIEDNLNYITEGVYPTYEEAEKSFEARWKTFNNSGIRFVDFYTAEIISLGDLDIKEAEEDDIEDMEDYLFQGDVCRYSGYLGMEEFEEFLKDWLG